MVQMRWEGICVWMTHGDEAVRLPDCFEVVARSTQGAVTGIEDRKRRFYVLQYHPEVPNLCLEERVSSLTVTPCNLLHLLCH
jgi:GMP synthase-like glutamine amidotransferase